MAPSAFDDEVRVGVGATVLAIPVPVDHYQRRRPNAYPTAWVIAPDSDEAVHVTLYLLPAAELRTPEPRSRRRS